jgi:N-acetyl-gamma-glutamyl-phosphate reductase
MKPKVYIDGKEGTTGLQIYDRLAAREDIDLLLIDEDKRKDPAERKRLMDAADIVFLCLPDAAAIEAVSLIESPTTRVIDASTAHRTNPDWDYGFPELSEKHREAIKVSKRVANPGCHATGFISVVYPLVAMGLLPKEETLSCFSLTGYSGGGKKMIAQYEDGNKPAELHAPCPYGMGQSHKHLPEMKAVCGLEKNPVFLPIVDDYYKGMATTVPFHMNQLMGVTTLREVWQKLNDYYGDAQLVKVAETTDIAKVYANAKAGEDSLQLIVAGNDEQFTITALFDNLGKGASGAAVQNMNIMLGLDETTGLTL